jgi:hypothetical protein
MNLFSNSLFTSTARDRSFDDRVESAGTSNPRLEKMHAEPGTQIMEIEMTVMNAGMAAANG